MSTNCWLYKRARSSAQSLRRTLMWQWNNDSLTARQPRTTTHSLHVASVMIGVHSQTKRSGRHHTYRLIIPFAAVLIQLTYNERTSCKWSRVISCRPRDAAHVISKHTVMQPSYQQQTQCSAFWRTAPPAETEQSSTCLCHCLCVYVYMYVHVLYVRWYIVRANVITSLHH